jgi:hypothetical protein
MEKNLAKNFVLQLGALGSLYLSIIFLLVLIFGVVNLLFPDATDRYWDIEQAQQSIRVGIAVLIVFYPVYLTLTRIVNQQRRAVSEGQYLALTKWLIYLSLLAGGLTLLINLVVVINTFLGGEVTERFVLKALAVLLIVGVAVFYYARDARGYWLTREKLSLTVGGLVSGLVLVTLVVGFLQIDTPTEVREQKLDQTQVQDLREIQWLIQDYYLANETLPQTLSDVPRANQYNAPEGRAEYEYKVTDVGFALCAEFLSEAPESERYAYPIAPDKDLTIIGADDWYYEPGEWCFERTVKTTP